MKKIHEAGQAKSIGISNFSIEQTDRARTAVGLPICTNQVEYHLRHNREKLRRYCHAHNVVLTAHRPLAQGELAQDEALKQVAASHGKSAAQVALKWLLQKGMIVIPKASSTAHLRDNLDLFDWRLGDEEMVRLDQVGGRFRFRFRLGCAVWCFNNSKTHRPARPRQCRRRCPRSGR